MSKTFKNVNVTIGGGVTNNRPVENGTAIIAAGGVNNAPVTGSVVVNGGVNSSLATVTGSVAVNSGTNAAPVIGVVRVASGAIQSGAITGSLYVEPGATIAPTTTIASGGNVYVAAGVDAAVVVSNISGFTGSVVQVDGGTLKSTSYNGGTAGAVNTVVGVFYNLENDNKAYTYSSTGKQLFAGPYFNLTGDGKAYTWGTDGTKGGLYTGAIGDQQYALGMPIVLPPPSEEFAEFTVSGDTNGGKLYTASGGSLTVGPVYTTSARTVTYGGLFTYNNQTYYTVTGVANLYRSWVVAGGSLLYTAPAGDVTVGPVKTTSDLTTAFTGPFTYNGLNYYATVGGTPNRYRAWSVSAYSNFGTLYTAAHDDVTTDTVYTNTALDSEYEGVFAYDNLTYYATEGAPVQYLSYTVTDDSNSANPGFLYSLTGFNAGPTDYLYTEPALVNKYTGYYFYNQGYYAEDGVVNTYRAWTINGNSFVTVTYTAPDAADITSGSYLVYSDTALQTPYADFYTYEGLTYLSSATGEPALLTGNNFGPNGAMFDYGANGTDNPTALSSGTYQLANGGLWYDVDSLGSGVLASGIKQAANGTWYSFASGNGEYLNGRAQASNGLWYNFDGDGGAQFETGIYEVGTTGVWYNFDGAGGAVFPAGINQAGDGCWYSFDGDDGSTDQLPTVAFADNKWRRFDNACDATLFTGGYRDAQNVYYSVNAGEVLGTYADGVAKLANDDKYYTFDGAGGAALFYGAGIYGTSYFIMAAGVIAPGADYADGKLRLADDGLYYSFDNSGNAGTALQGVHEVAGTYSYFSAGSKGALFNGIYQAGNQYYYSIVDGVASSSHGPKASPGLYRLVSDNKYYSYDGDYGVTALNGAYTMGYFLNGEIDSSYNSDAPEVPQNSSDFYIYTNGVAALFEGLAITYQPEDITVYDTGNAVFTVDVYVSTADTITYKWQFKEPGDTDYTDIVATGVYAGSAPTTNTLTFTGNKFLMHENLYRCVVTAGSYSATTRAAQLDMNERLEIRYFGLTGFRVFLDGVDQGAPADGSKYYITNDIPEFGIYTGFVYIFTNGANPAKYSSIFADAFYNGADNSFTPHIYDTHEGHFYVDGLPWNGSINYSTPDYDPDYGTALYTVSHKDGDTLGFYLGWPEGRGGTKHQTVNVQTAGNVRTIIGNIDYTGLTTRPSKLTLHNAIVNGHVNFSSLLLTTLVGAPASVGGSIHINNNNLATLEGMPAMVGSGYDVSAYSNQLVSLKGMPSNVGYFDCSNNLLRSLEYAPTSVNGSFLCNSNLLTSLQYAPTSVNGSFLCNSNQLTSLQGAPTSVNGSFLCNSNQLTSLQGAPTSVSGDFICSNNQLTSLQYAPTTVGTALSGSFDCSNNQLTSLQYAPASVGGGFYCLHNLLTSLQYAPATVSSDFNCNNNLLTSLQYAPASVGGGFYCLHNLLTSLQYAPATVSGNFNCSNNLLTSLQYAPTSVSGGSFDCSNNQITSLQYAPTSVGLDFNCSYNQLTSLQYAPTSVSGGFYCFHNLLTSLQYAPTSVGGNFNCSNNLLTSLQYAPATVGAVLLYGSNSTLTLPRADTAQGGVNWIYNTTGTGRYAIATTGSVASSVGYYVDNVKSTTFTTTTPTKAADNNNFYTYANGAPTFARAGTVAGFAVTYSDGQYSIAGNVIIVGEGRTTLPDFSGIYVEGSFLCYSNQLTSLQGAPASVGGHFNCENNQLTSLQYAPTSVVGAFTYRYNSTLTLPRVDAAQGGVYWSYDADGVSRSVANNQPVSTGYVVNGALGTGFTTTTPTKALDDGNFYTYSNGTSTFARSGKVAGYTVTYSDGQYRIAGSVSLDYQNLTTLPDFSGIYVGGYFYAQHNQLTSLQGAPTSVGGHFSCSWNNLTSLQGAPTSVGGSFYCELNTQLASLQYAPCSGAAIMYYTQTAIPATPQYATDSCGNVWFYRSSATTRIKRVGAFSHGYYTASTVLDTSYTTTTPTKAIDDNNFYTYTNGVATFVRAGTVAGYTVTYSDGQYRIAGNVNLISQSLTALPDFSGIYVSGSFLCRNNQLTSLQGAPASVGSIFDCRFNNLTSLQGAPTSVGVNFDCSNNQLTSLQYAPTSVGVNFICRNNQLTSLQYAPTSVGGNFDCGNNQLTSLQGAPTSVGGIFDCQNNQLTSLQYAPTSVGGSFNCNTNNLTSLQGVPASVGGSFSCTQNLLTRLDGAPCNILNNQVSYASSRATLSSNVAPDSCGSVWTYSNNTRTMVTNPVGAYSFGYYTAGSLDASYTTTTPTKATDNDNFYTYTNGVATFARVGKVAGYTVTYSDGQYRIAGDITLSSQNRTTLPDFSGIYVSGSFYCGSNQLTSLQGAPTSVGENFECDINQLTSLQYAPTSVGSSFTCSRNNLTSLQGAPTSVGNAFEASYNPLLTSLEGAPSNMPVGYFYLNSTGLTLPGVYAAQGGAKWLYNNVPGKRILIPSTGAFPTSVGYYTAGSLDASYTTTTPTKAENNDNFYTYTNGVATLARVGKVAGYTVTYSDGQYRIAGNVVLNSNALTLPDFSGIHVSGNFACGSYNGAYNSLTSFTGAPARVDGNFWGGSNSNMNSLAGLPSYIGGNCELGNIAKLTNLVGAPSHVGGFFSVQGDYYSKLTSLVGAPCYIGGYMYFPYPAGAPDVAGTPIVYPHTALDSCGVSWTYTDRNSRQLTT